MTLPINLSLLSLLMFLSPTFSHFKYYYTIVPFPAHFFYYSFAPLTLDLSSMSITTAAWTLLLVVCTLFLPYLILS